MTALAGTDVATDDAYAIVDTSVTTTKKILHSELKIAIGITTGTTASTFTFDGSGGDSASVTLTWQKIGNWVTLNIPAATATTGTNSTKLASNTALAAAVRPTAGQDQYSAIVQNNGAALTTPGFIRITTAGIVEIFRDGAASVFTDASSSGLNRATSVSYFLG